MKLVDANVLLYAVNENAPHHAAARSWLDDALSGAARVGFAWVSLLAFVRIASHPSIFPAPLTPADALSRVEEWLAAPAASLLAPTGQHAAVMARLLAGTPTGGNIVTDAHLAALAIEHRAEIVSFDRDFERFPGVRRVQP